jgi:hypothetical protein
MLSRFSFFLQTEAQRIGREKGQRVVSVKMTHLSTMIFTLGVTQPLMMAEAFR